MESIPFVGDPHISVTFVFVSESGSTIAKGLQQGKDGLEDPSFQLPSQLGELKSILQGRQPDIMTVSIGGNDIQFAPVINGLLLANIESNYNLSKVNTVALAETGDPSWTSTGISASCSPTTLGSPTG